MAIRTVSAA